MHIYTFLYTLQQSHTVYWPNLKGLFRVCRLRYYCGDRLLMTIIPLLQSSQLTVLL